MNENEERRQDYPDILRELQDIRAKQEHHFAALERHITETQEITELWLHSRWLLQSLKYLAALAAVLVGGWLALKQLFAGH